MAMLWYRSLSMLILANLQASHALLDALILQITVWPVLRSIDSHLLMPELHGVSSTPTTPSSHRISSTDHLLVFSPSLDVLRILNISQSPLISLRVSQSFVLCLCHVWSSKLSLLVLQISLKILV